MTNVGFKLKRLLIISPVTLVFTLLPLTGLAIDVKDVPKLSPASQELTQDTHLPWVLLVGGGALVLAIAATQYVRCRRRWSKRQPSAHSPKVISSDRDSQCHSNVCSSSSYGDVDDGGDDSDDSNDSDWDCQPDSGSDSFGGDSSGGDGAGGSYGSSESLDSSSCSSYDSGSNWNSDSSNCSSYDSDSSWSSDSSSSSSSYDSSSSWSSDSSDSGSSWSSDSSSSSSSSSYDSSSSSDYGGGSSGGGGADGSW